MAVTIIDLNNYLKGVSYPSKKDGLLQKAQENKAPRDVIDLITHLPDQDFHSVAEVSEAVGYIR